MTSWGDAGGAPRMPGRAEGHPLWVKLAFIGGVLILAFVASRACQEEQIEVSDDEAVGIAREEIDFEPTDVQVRLLRQGLNREPFWFVSLGLESRNDPDVFARLAVIQVDAKSGAVESIEQDRNRDREAAEQAQDGAAAGTQEQQGQATEP